MADSIPFTHARKKGEGRKGGRRLGVAWEGPGYEARQKVGRGRTGMGLAAHLCQSVRFL